MTVPGLDSNFTVVNIGKGKWFAYRSISVTASFQEWTAFNEVHTGSYRVSIGVTPSVMDHSKYPGSIYTVLKKSTVYYYGYSNGVGDDAKRVEDILVPPGFGMVVGVKGNTTDTMQISLLIEEIFGQGYVS